MKKFIGLILSGFLFVSVTQAQQTAEVSISLNEQFFDVLLEAVFTNLEAPKVSLAQSFNRRDAERPREDVFWKTIGFEKSSASPRLGGEKLFCDESIRLQREIDGVKTAVRFRNGKIYVPIAFKGNYNPPLIGCIDFQGWAETNVELEFDERNQTLVGRAKVLNVMLSGTGGVGSGLITRLVQSSIDSKINPIKILDMEKVSFVVPVQKSGNLKMKALGVRHDIGEGVLNVHIKYQFLKG